MPQYIADYYGKGDYMQTLLEAGENTWKPLNRYAIQNKITIEMISGEIVNDLPIEISVTEQGNVEFIFSGGFGYIPITFIGINNSKNHIFMEQIDGVWRNIDQSIFGNDFWQIEPDNHNGLNCFTYNINRNIGEILCGSTRYLFK